MFERSPVMLSPFKVTKYLYCDAGPLSDLSMSVSIILPLYGHISLVHTHSRIHSTHTDIIHACLYCQSCLNYTESVTRNVIQKCCQSSISQVAGPQGSLLPVYSRFPSILPSLVIISVKVMDGISFRMLVFIPVKVNDGIFFRMTTVFPFVRWSLS